MVEPGKIELQKADVDESVHPWEALVETERSIVSAGTEGAGFIGLVKQIPFGNEGQGQYPRDTGMGIWARRSGWATRWRGWRKATECCPFSNHASAVKADRGGWRCRWRKRRRASTWCLRRWPGSASPRSSSVQPGDKVLVVGGGLVGYFACQLFRLAGADVMLADLSDLRLEQARSCGIEHTVNSEREDLEAAVKDWTDGVGARVGVEAIGISEVVAQTVMCAARYGEVILLGCPRAPTRPYDVTPMLLRIHLEAIKMIGALEWCWPQHATERTRDLDANYRQIAEWIAGGKNGRRAAVEPSGGADGLPGHVRRVYVEEGGVTERGIRLVE